MRVIDEVILDYVYRTPAVGVNAYRTIGTNVFDREWDALIVLDTARVDALRIVADEYNFIKNVESIWSVGGHQQNGSHGRLTNNIGTKSGTQHFSPHRAISKKYSIRRYTKKTVTDRSRSKPSD